MQDIKNNFFIKIINCSCGREYLVTSFSVTSGDPRRVDADDDELGRTTKSVAFSLIRLWMVSAVNEYTPWSMSGVVCISRRLKSKSRDQIDP
jgi:hypothetical protein